MLKTLSLGLVGAMATLAMTPAVSLAENAGVFLMGGSSFTWQVLAPGETGYACLTDDRLMGMAATARADRYRVQRQGNRFTMTPVSAIEVYPQERGYIAVPVEPIPVQELWSYLPHEGNWVSPDATVEPVGSACVDGGMAGFRQYLEREYRISIYQSLLVPIRDLFLNT